MRCKGWSTLTPALKERVTWNGPFHPLRMGEGRGEGLWGANLRVVSTQPVTLYSARSMCHVERPTIYKRYRGGTFGQLSARSLRGAGLDWKMYIFNVSL